MSIRQLFDLSGRVAAITGGARGIGRTCAAALQEFGCQIALLDILPDAPSSPPPRRATARSASHVT